MFRAVYLYILIWKASVAIVDGWRLPVSILVDTTTTTTTNKNIDCNNRRDFGKLIFGSLFMPLVITTTASTSTTTKPANAIEVIGTDPTCIDRQKCLGVWDDLLADCPHDNKLQVLKTKGAGCTASQDDTPGIFSEPWDYSESSSLDWEFQMKLLLPTIQLVSSRRGDTADILLRQGRYLRVLFMDGKTKEESIGEFYFTPNDTTVQFRVGSISGKNNGTSSSSSSSQPNIERCEQIRKEMRYLKLPVLRNRKRSLFFVESEFDSFGPGSANLKSPAEMNPNEYDPNWQGKDPKLKLDTLQQFPFSNK